MKTPDRILFMFYITLLILFMTSGKSLAFRCGTHLVSDGDTREEVAYKCGDPDFVDSWEEERIYRDFRFERNVDPRTSDLERYRTPFLVKKNVKIDVWTYNLGSNRFTRFLTFENGILAEISTGKKGH